MSGAPTAEAIAAAARWLRSTEAVRARSRLLFDAAKAGTLSHARLNLEKLDAAAEYVARAIRENYPDLRVPYHSRWRHFDAGRDRWGALRSAIEGDAVERAVAAADLAVVSVLLDAGAGAAWRYEEPGTSAVLSRSEGLAVASLHMFRAGAFSSDRREPLRVDADALEAMTPEKLSEGLQIRRGNPLAGLENRAELLRRLGVVLKANPDIFGTPARPGRLIAFLMRAGTSVRAHDVLVALLETLGPIWPAGLMFHGHNLGDVGRHSKVSDTGVTDGLVPFHKLSQWLAYSLIEPLEWAGATVTQLDDLTGLPEYRNGGLFIDMGVIVPQGNLVSDRPLDPRDAAVVEWRALTVVLLDDLAPLVRRLLNMNADRLPLAKVLQGGTWSAGRKIAAERRPGGSPPVRVATDGTTF